MQFVKYPSITNTYRGDELDYIRINHADDIKDVTWNVYEKIHGANFSIWYDGTECKIAKRSGWCSEDFYSCKDVVEKNMNNVKMLYSLLKVPFVVYGELFGGLYAGTYKDNKAKQIQREVQYCPHNDFAAFDIAKINEDSTLSYVDEETFQDLAFAAGFYVVPFLATYNTLDEAIAFPVEFGTLVPNRWSLKPIDNNYSEGVVIKPSKPLFMFDNKRIIFKKKSDKFKEAKSVEVDSCTTDEFIKFFEHLKAQFTVNRFNNVVSHHGTDEKAFFYFEEFMKDSLDDCDQIVYNSLSDQQKKLLRTLSAKYVWPIIREIIYKKEADVA